MQGTRKARIAERLKQVVESPGFESLQGVLIVSGHENDRRRSVSAEHLEDVEAIVLGHANIEEHQVGFQAPNRFEAFGCRAVLSKQFNLRVLAKQEHDV